MAKYRDIEFIRTVAVTQFNQQYGKNFNPKDFDVFSIAPCYSDTHGYEIYSVRSDDKLRLHLYFNIGQSDDFMPYRLENDMSDKKGELGDEVYVMIGFLTMWRKRYEKLTLEWIDQEVLSFGVLLQENAFPILTEDDGYILL